MKFKINYFLKFKQERIKTTEMCLFWRQLSLLLTAQLPIVQSCDILIKSQNNLFFRQLIYFIQQQIIGGKPLSFSLNVYRKHFDHLTRQLVKIGEQTGRLDEMLNLIANYHEKKLTFINKIKQLLFYPCMILIVTLLMLVGLFIFVIPRFAELFQDVSEQLPFITRLLFKIASMFQAYGGSLCAAFFLILIIFFYSQKNRLGIAFVLHFLAHFPPFKNYLKNNLLTHFARQLAIALHAGLPIMDCLQLTSHTYDTHFNKLISDLQKKIRSGIALHRAMEPLDYFPPLLIHMVKIGEQTGKLEQLLDKTADFMEADANQSLAYFSKLLEPLIMLFLGALIGGLVIGIYLPIFKLGTIL